MKVVPIGKQGINQVATADKLKEMGWRVENLDSGWSAYEIHGDRKIGPAKTLAALETMIGLASGPKAKEQAAAAKNGNGAAAPAAAPSSEASTNGKAKKTVQQVLPETKAAVLEQLGPAVKEYRATTMEILRLQGIQKTQKEDLLDMMHRFEDVLEVDPLTGFKFYEVEGIIAEITIEEKEVLKTREA